MKFISSSGYGIPFMHIVLVNAKTKKHITPMNGFVTNANGEVDLPPLSKGFLYKISAIGKQTVFLDNKVLSKGTLLISDSTTSLPTFEVVATSVKRNILPIAIGITVLIGAGVLIKNKLQNQNQPL